MERINETQVQDKYKADVNSVIDLSITRLIQKVGTDSL